MLTVLFSLLLAAAALGRHLQLAVDVFHGPTADSMVPGHARVYRRTSGVSVDMANMKLYYTVNFTLGSDKQAVAAQLDTGSLDLWVSGPNNRMCSTNNDAYRDARLEYCSVLGIFSPNTLATFRTNGTAFSINYMSNTGAEGVWASDTLRIGGVVLDNYVFAVANKSTMKTNVFGIGLPLLEASIYILSSNTQNRFGDSFIYHNLPMRLYHDGVIDWPMYLLWINDLDASSGTVLFGAVDYAKFTGPLLVVPMVVSDASSTYVSRTSVAINGIRTLKSQDQLLAAPACGNLDLGATLTYLPPQTVDRLAKQLSLSWHEMWGAYVGQCSQDMSGNFTFEFDGFEFDIPLSSYWVEFSADENGAPLCWLTIIPQPNPDGLMIGDNTLRHMYVAYDLGNLEIGIARAVVGTDEADIRSAHALDRATYVAALPQTHSLFTVVPGADNFTSPDSAWVEHTRTMYATYAGNYNSDSNLGSNTDLTVAVEMNLTPYSTEHTPQTTRSHATSAAHSAAAPSRSTHANGGTAAPAALRARLLPQSASTNAASAARLPPTCVLALLSVLVLLHVLV